MNTAHCAHLRCIYWRVWKDNNITYKMSKNDSIYPNVNVALFFDYTVFHRDSETWYFARCTLYIAKWRLDTVKFTENWNAQVTWAEGNVGRETRPANIRVRFIMKVVWVNCEWSIKGNSSKARSQVKSWPAGQMDNSTARQVDRWTAV